MRIAMGIEYDGSHFCGWQAQKQDVPTVQGTLEAGLSQVANEEIKVVCAGRTDAGVHACGQVIHFETSAERSERSWVHGTNANIDKTISVQWAKPVVGDVSCTFWRSASALSLCDCLPRGTPYFRRQTSGVGPPGAG